MKSHSPATLWVNQESDPTIASTEQLRTSEHVSQLRSFLGLANQLTAFVPNLAHMSATPRPLLKRGTVASRLFGIGFALLQPLPNEKWSLIQCGSASLTPTQTRYTTIELECMAIQKCSYYLRGLSTFEQWTDHKTLVGIFAKNICDLENPRLKQMREKIMEYTTIVKWVPGKSHYIADALSRSPMFDTNENEYPISCNYQSVQSAWGCIKEGTKIRTIYRIEEVEFVFRRKLLKFVLVKTALNLGFCHLICFSISDFSLVLISDWSDLAGNSKNDENGFRKSLKLENYIKYFPHFL